MSTDFSPELKRELLDDFYTECDELLTNIRGALSQLSEQGNQQTKGDVIETLFRNLHSVKGISAIVGLRPAEQLAHAMEDLLRGWSKAEVHFSEAWLDVLSSATQRLEQIVATHRLAKPLPEIGDVLEELSRLAPNRNGAAPSSVIGSEAFASVGSVVAVAQSDGLRYLVSFAPSAALNDRGINVNLVRERLRSIGEIESATPSVREKGSIVFEFVLRVRELPTDLSAWEADGMRFESFIESHGAAAEGSTVTTAAPQVEALSIAPSHIVRVDLTRLDELMRIVGEMVILRSRLEERLARGSDRAALKEIDSSLGRSLREMRAAISKVRTVPIAEIFSRMPFVVQDLSRGTGKKVRVTLEGHNTEVDKFIVERLKEPLLHLVRNSFAHAVEAPELRIAAGKPAEATIALSAKSSGQSVVIQVRDDGQGIDVPAIAARATALGLPVPQPLDPAGVLKILCTPGFSTRQEADLAAGRGVGMAVVANTVRELGGTLVLASTRGIGTEFTLKLPVTLAIVDAIVVSVGEQICAVPQSAVEEIIQIAAKEVRTINQVEVIPYRGGLLPFLRLRKIFKLAAENPETITMLVVQGERGTTGVAVDRVRSQSEIVVRPLSDPLLRVPGISGATELGDGRPILVLDPIALTQSVVRPPTSPPNFVSAAAEARAS